MSADFTKRAATPADLETAFGIKKAAGGEYIKRVFGWNEELQLKMHGEQFIPSNTLLIVKDGRETVRAVWL